MEDPFADLFPSGTGQGQGVSQSYAPEDPFADLYTQKADQEPIGKNDLTNDQLDAQVEGSMTGFGSAGQGAGGQVPEQTSTQPSRQIQDPFADLLQSQPSPTPSQAKYYPLTFAPGVKSPTSDQPTQAQPSQLVSGLSGLGEGTIGTLAGLGAAGLISPLAAATGPFAIPIELGAFAVGAKLGEIGSKRMEELLGVKPEVEASQQAYPKTAEVAGLATMAPFAVESGLKYGATALTKGIGQAAIQAGVGAGIGAGVMEPLRYAADYGAYKAGATPNAPEPITFKSMGEQALTGMALGGMSPHQDPSVNAKEGQILDSADQQAPHFLYRQEAKWNQLRGQLEDLAEGIFNTPDGPEREAMRAKVMTIADQMRALQRGEDIDIEPPAPLPTDADKFGPKPPAAEEKPPLVSSAGGEVPPPAPGVGETPAVEPTADLESLVNQQLEHEEGSPEYNAIQEKIDALNKPSEEEQQVPPNSNVNPKYITPANKITKGRESDVDKMSSEMSNSGWIGRPLLIAGDEAITGSHRIYAARKAGLENIPTYKIPESVLSDFNKWLLRNPENTWSIDLDNWMHQGDKEKLHDLNRAKDEGINGLDESINLLNQEIRSNSEGQSASKETQPTTQNESVQEPSARETMLQPEGAGEGQGVELQGVGEENKPEVPAEKGEEEVATTGPIEEAKPIEPIEETPNKITSKSEKITDFGEKIEGAKKDLWQRYETTINADLPNDVKDISITKHFPEPDYGKLIDSGASVDRVATMKAIRDLIPRKPQRGYKLSKWGELVKALHESLKLAVSPESKISNEKLNEIIQKSPSIAGKVDLYKELGYPAFLGAKSWDIKQSRGFSLFGGEKIPPSEYVTYAEHDGRMVSVNSRNQNLVEARKEVAQKVAGMIESKQDRSGGAEKNSRSTTFNVYHDRYNPGKFIIGKKGLTSIIRIKSGFDNSQDAFNYIKDNHADISKLWEQLKTQTTGRKDVNEERTGKPQRTGNITPETFSESFGFRGVQFGNYVEGSRRQTDLNHSFDALMDLSEALGLSPKALSLDGQLGMSFGARGRGGKNPASAHYEPDNVVINLTKASGPGSLAHEWFHAVDNYFNRLDKTGNSDWRSREFNYSSDNSKPPVNMRPEVWEAFKNLRNTLSKGEFAKRSKDLDETRSKPYWGTTIEKAARAFESYIKEKLFDKGISNDYLANIDETSGAYPTKEELGNGIREAFDNLFNAINETELPKLAESIKTKILLGKSTGESGFIDPSIFEDIADYGTRIFEKGMDFADWSKKMISDLGVKVKGVLEKIWNAYKSSRFASEAGSLGSAADEFAERFRKQYIKSVGKEPTQAQIDSQVAKRFPKTEAVPEPKETATQPGVGNEEIPEKISIRTKDQADQARRGILSNVIPEGEGHTISEINQIGNDNLAKGQDPYEALQKAKQGDFNALATAKAYSQGLAKKVNDSLKKYGSKSKEYKDLAKQYQEYYEGIREAGTVASDVLRSFQGEIDLSSAADIVARYKEITGEEPSLVKHEEIAKVADSVEKSSTESEEATKKVTNILDDGFSDVDVKVPESVEESRQQVADFSDAQGKANKEEIDRLNNELEQTKRDLEEIKQAKITGQDTNSLREYYEAKIKDLNDQLAEKPKYGKVVFDAARRIVDRWKSEAADAEKELSKKLAQMGSGPDPTIVVPLAKMIRAWIGEFGVNKAEALTRTIARFGEKFRPHFEAAWNKAQELINGEVGAEKTIKKSRQVKEKPVSKMTPAEKTADNLRKRISQYEKKIKDIEEGRVTTPKDIEKVTNDEIESLEKQLAEKKQKLSDARIKAKQKELLEAGKSGFDLNPQQAKTLWETAKKFYIDKGELDFDKMVNDLARDHGLTTDQVRKAFTIPKGAKRATDEMYVKQLRRQQALASAKRWLVDQKANWIGKTLGALAEKTFKLAIFGHGTAFIGTHAPTTIYTHPRSAFKAWLKGLSYSFRGKSGKIQNAIDNKDLVNRATWSVAKRAGLENDPYAFGREGAEGPRSDTFIANALDKITGGRGFDALFHLRQDMFDQAWDKLSITQRTPEMAQVISDGINNATGFTKGGERTKGLLQSPITKILFFAPKLIASRFKWMIQDPAKMINTFFKMATGIKTTPEERMGAIYEAKNKASFIATVAGTLLANQAILSAIGSNQNINFTDPKKNDWLAYKGFGYSLSTIGAFTRIARLMSQEYNAVFGDLNRLQKAKGGREAAIKDAIYTYFRSGFSPIVRDIVVGATGKDYLGNTVPWSSERPDRGRRKLTWGELVQEQFAPIPLSEAATQNEPVSAFAKAASAAFLGTRLETPKDIAEYQKSFKPRTSKSRSSGAFEPYKPISPLQSSP